jgi:hypothetical protein
VCFGDDVLYAIMEDSISSLYLYRYHEVNSVWNADSASGIV